MFLPFACGHMVLVELTKLQKSEERLDRRRRIGVWAGVHDWHLHLPEILTRLGTAMIGSIVHEQE